MPSTPPRMLPVPAGRMPSGTPVPASTDAIAALGAVTAEPHHGRDTPVDRRPDMALDRGRGSRA